MSLVLARSGNQPLHFLFISSSVECDKEASFMVFQMLLSQGTRWRSAILCVDLLHMPLLYSLHDRCPQLLSCQMMMQEPVAQYASNVYAFEFAESIQVFRIIGLGPTTSVFLPASRLTQFADRCFTIDCTTLERIVSFLPLAGNLAQVEMQYLHITGNSSPPGATHPAILSKVVFFRMGCIGVMNSVTLPTLHALLVGTGFHDLAGLNHPDLNPLTLTSVKNMLVRLKCQNTLCTIEFHKLTLTDDILAIIHLSPALEEMLLEVSSWETETDMVLQRLLAELGHTNSNSTLSCIPLLSLLTLHVKYVPHHLVLSFYHDGLVDTMELRVSSDPDTQFTLSILFKNDNTLFLPLDPDSRSRLVQCQNNGSICTFTVGDVTDEHDSIVCFLD
ncbi:hypothetical protein ARMGADRAFT_1087744 [Armillaria gallica]|uniref:F-box domain-containing protein n=1 Tax=Armillaria gallica TaxID=47427 RepID=A0A2H3D7L8_ARMGA|nr:hypothetical protein ARMGADRAFT_1087744 [Armillaria gallica]